MKDTWNAFMREDVELEPTDKGRLDGLAFAVKDVFGIQGYTSSAGNPDWLRTHGPAPNNAESIDRLLKAGARLAGTTHTDELMFSLNGQNEHYGTPVNPKAPDRIPGGSSSGSAVAVAGGLVDFALGTDTGGSVRVPSAYCGIYGIRPTHGAIPMDGVIPLAESFDTVGWMASDPRVLLSAGLALLGREEPREASFRRILFPQEAWSLADPASLGLLGEWKAALRTQAEQSGLAAIAPEGLSVWMRTFRMIQGLEIWEKHGAWIEREKPRFGQVIGERFAWARTLRRSESGEWIRLQGEIRERMCELLGEHTLLAMPTAPGAAPLRDIGGAEDEKRRTSTMHLSCIAGLAGLPQVTIPAGMADGAPIGISLIAGPLQDIKLLKWVEERMALWQSKSGIAPAVN